MFRIGHQRAGGLEEKSRLTTRAVSRQEPNVQGGGWSRFGGDNLRR